jgi:hypothetical protein
LRVQAAAGYTASGAAAVWVVAEAVRGARTGARDDWSNGGQIDIVLVTRAGEAVANRHITLPASDFAERVTLNSSGPLPPGDYMLQIRGTSAGGSVTSLADAARIIVPEPSGAAGAIFARRGPTTGNRQVHTADVRFRRTEQLFIDIPATSPEVPRGRLLDRTGKAMAVPVTAGIRADQDGSRWHTAHVVLAPLAPGDYLVEMTAGTSRTLTAFRVVR